MNENNNLNKVLLFANLLLLAVIVISFDKGINKFNDLFKGFNINLPFFTKLILTRTFFIIVAMLLMVKELLKDKKLVLIINVISTFFIWLVVPVMIVIGMFLPIFQLTKIGN